MASQMKEALFDQTTILIDVKTKTPPSPPLGKGGIKRGYQFKAAGRVVKFEGFIKVYVFLGGIYEWADAEYPLEGEIQK